MVIRSEKQLKSDVDYTYKKLQKLHPNLYWYISKKELDFKFDSLKSTINAPMTSNDFYFRLSPVLAFIKQGHTKIGRSAIKARTLSRFDYDIFDSKLYIVKTNWGDKSILPGTEVVSINNIKTRDLIEKYRNVLYSDGNNQTFVNRGQCLIFEKYFKYENIPLDSIVYELKYKDSIRSVCLNCKPVSDSITLKKIIKQKKTIIQETKLSFPQPDSSIALIRIKGFDGDNSQFYRNSFAELNTKKTEVLVIDVRNNLGGRLKDVYNLYSYLTDSNFYFIDQSEVASRTSLLHTNQFGNASITGKIFIAAFSPLRWIFTGIRYCKVQKDVNNKYYYHLTASKPGYPKPDHFKGKVYVLINGGSYSASCILLSNLKGSKRAVLVGEETGGAYNGCVAGIMPIFTLPHSKLVLNFGLNLIQPWYKTDIEGRGIFPDVEIKPTLEDRVEGNDPELQWVLNEITNQHKLHKIDNKGITNSESQDTRNENK